MSTDVSALETYLQAGWLLLCTALVLFMQAGFTALEAGTVRHKSSINVAVKNIVTIVLAVPAFYVIGYSLRVVIWALLAATMGVAVAGYLVF